jgi:ABC-2 type transport system permease protein
MQTVTQVTPEKHSDLYWAFSDSFILIKRSLTHITRNLDQLLAAAFQPIMFMLLFRYIFGGAINTGTINYMDFLMAGILVQTAAFGAMTTAVGVATDLQRGIVDRFRSLPMISSAVMTGHVVADLARNTLSTVIMILFGLVIGFRPTASLTEWVLVIGLVLLFTFALSWLSAVLGLLAKSIEAVQWISFIVVFPLTFASSTFVPTTNMPYALKLFAENQPITHVIEALRSLLVGTPMGNHGWLAVVWCLGIIVVSIPWAAVLFRNRGNS